MTSPGARGPGEGPSHPTGTAILLVIGVVVLIVLLSVMSTLG